MCYSSKKYSNAWLSILGVRDVCIQIWINFIIIIIHKSFVLYANEWNEIAHFAPIVLVAASVRERPSFSDQMCIIYNIIAIVYCKSICTMLLMCVVFGNERCTFLTDIIYNT